jgi:hypothetical protein
MVIHLAKNCYEEIYDFYPMFLSLASDKKEQKLFRMISMNHVVETTWFATGGHTFV